MMSYLLLPNKVRVMLSENMRGYLWLANTRFRCITAITLLFAVASCSQLTYVNCEPHSWHGLGVRDGLRGISPRAANEYERTCDHQSLVFDRLAYEAGLNQGNAQYCSGQNGFHLGLSGVETENVCVDKHSVTFKAGLRTGRKLRKAVLDLDPSNFPMKHDLGGFTIVSSSSYTTLQVALADRGLDEDPRGEWVPVMLTPPHPRASDKRIKRSIRAANLIARCEEAKQNAKERGFYTSLNCSPL